MKETAPQIAFMLSQLGAHAAAEFRALLQDLNLTTGHSGIIRLVSMSERMSQKDLADRLSLLPSRLVVLIDELEARKLMERQSDPSDRRSHILRLTDKGRQTLKSLNAISKKLGDQLCATLSENERASLLAALSKIADAEGLSPGVHPGFKTQE